MNLIKKLAGPVLGVVVGVGLTLLLNKPVEVDTPPFTVEDVSEEPVVVSETPKPTKRTAPKPA